MQQIYSLHSDDLLIDNLYNVGADWSPAYFRGEWDKSVMIAAVAFGRNSHFINIISAMRLSLLMTAWLFYA